MYGDRPENLDLSKKSNRVFVLVFLTVLIVVAFIFGYRGFLWPFFKSQDCQDWVETECIVKYMEADTGLSSGPRPAKKVAEIKVSYEYEFNGEMYYSNNYRYGPHALGGDISWENYNPGDIAKCYVNPDNPREAVMIREIYSPGFLWGLLPLFLIIIGILGIVKVIRYNANE